MRKIATVALVATLSACSSVPNVEYSYHPSKSNTVVTVTQTVDCNADKTAVYVVNTPSVTTTYSSDLSKIYKFDIKAVEGRFGSFADSDMSFSFFDDGRLKSINQSTTGQGETFIKSAVSLAGSLAALGGVAPPSQAAALEECGVISRWGGGKPITLTYSARINLATEDAKELEPAPGNKTLYNALQKQLPKPVSLRVTERSLVGSRARFLTEASESSGDLVPLQLQDTSTVTAEIRTSGQVIGTTTVTIPNPNSSYILPIPRAALFGKQVFSLTLSEAGAITAINYGKNSGGAGAANAAKTIMDAFAPDSTAQKVSEIKAQADLIAQQQRLARCQAQPDKCQ